MRGGCVRNVSDACGCLALWIHAVALPGVGAPASFMLGAVPSSGASSVVAEVVVAGCAVVPSSRGRGVCEKSATLVVVLLSVDGCTSTAAHLLHH